MKKNKKTTTQTNPALDAFRQFRQQSGFGSFQRPNSANLVKPRSGRRGDR